MGVDATGKFVAFLLPSLSSFVPLSRSLVAPSEYATRQKKEYLDYSFAQPLSGPLPDQCYVAAGTSQAPPTRPGKYSGIRPNVLLGRCWYWSPVVTLGSPLSCDPHHTHTLPHSSLATTAFLLRP